MGIFVELYTFIKKVAQIYKISIIIPLLHRISNFAHFFLDIENIQINIPRIPPMSPNIDWNDQNLLLFRF